MNALQLACTAKTTSLFKNFDNIAVGEYEVLEFSIVDTKYGKKIRVTTAEFFCFLPGRFASFLTEAEQIEELNRIPHIMRFKGKDRKRQNRLDLEFIPLNESQWIGMEDLLTLPIVKQDEVKH